MFSKIRSLLFSEQEQQQQTVTGNEGGECAAEMMENSTSSIKVTDEKPCFEVTGQNVDIYVNARRQDHGSSRVKLKNIVDYNWEVKKYHGRLIAVHRDGQVVAYSIKLKTVGMVRVWWNGERALIKGMSNEVLDIQFAHMSTKIILACVDESSLHIYRVETETGKLETSLLLKVENPVEDSDPRNNRINWCPFVPSTEDDDDYANHLLVWSQGDTFQCLNVHLVLDAYGVGSSYDFAQLTEGVMQHSESKATITAATFSPDGTTLSVGFDDGNVYFYQIYLYSKESAPRRLFNWKPHDQKPVTALAFLDDHTQRMSENGSFWKHALTATDNNTEIKLWRCDDWSCIQRICFKPTVYDTFLDFKLDIDSSSSYLVLSEQTNRVLYALQIAKEEHVNGAGGVAAAEEGKESTAVVMAAAEGKVTSTVSFKSVGEFPLSSSILSFNIAGATKGKYNCGRLEDDADEYDEEGTINQNMSGVMIQMFLVQPKSVQECHVFFQTENPSVPDECTPSGGGESVDMVLTPTTTHNRQKSSAQINLMTPESFQTPPGKDSPGGVPNAVLTTIRMLAAATTPGSDSKANHETMLSYAALEEEQNKNLRKSLEMRISSTEPSSNPVASSTVNNSEILPSGSSSPSREVQEILSLKDEMFENMQTSDMILDEELEVNSSGGNGTEADVDDVAEQADLPNGNDGVHDERENHNLEANKVMEGIDSIKLYVDDDEDNEADEICGGGGGGGVGNMEWPKVPNILPDMARLENAQKLPRSANSSAQATFSYPLNNLSSTSSGQTATGVNSFAVESKLDRILEMLDKNSEQISSLERRLSQWEQKQQMQVNNSSASFTNNLASSANSSGTISEAHSPNAATAAAAIALDKKLNKSLDSHLMRCEHLIKYELDDVQKKQTKQLTVMREQLVQMLRQQFTEKVVGSWFAEMQPNLLKLVAREMENIKGLIQYEVANKLSVSDKLLQENLSYVCSNKNLMESFAAAIRSGVQHTVQVTFMEQMNKLVIPAYERASKEMFKQTNEMFQKGVNNYSKQVHSYMTQFQPVHDQNEKLLSAMKVLPEQFKVTNEKVINSFSAQILHEVNKDFKTLQLNILKLIKDAVKQEVSKGFESQVANLEDSVLSAVRSQAQTPSVFDIQEQIRALIGQGQINKAFHQALISNDLALVEFTLEKADIKEVFNPTRLEQTVLLSLIQQLSADMSAYTATKHQYLSEAITSLNMKDPVIREHAPKILKQLSQSLHDYMDDHPNGQFGSRIKMLQMMIAGAGFAHFP